MLDHRQHTWSRFPGSSLEVSSLHGASPRRPHTSGAANFLKIYVKK